MATQPYHELLWLGCAAKRCCSLRTVRPTGGDIWRIATRLHVPPESFLRTIPAEPVEHGFLLAPDGQPCQLALARRVATARQATCVFLMRIGDEAARCGLGELRPLPCQAFPAEGTGRVFGIDRDNGCTCRTWNLADLDRAVVADLLRQQADERAFDRQIVDEWNAQIAASTRPSWSLAEFCGFLLHTYSNRGAT